MAEKTYANAGSTTSEQAAEKAEPFAGSLEQKVYSLIVDSGDHGMTVDELKIYFPNNVRSSISPRVVSLKEKGRICESGRVRLTRSKRNANVYISTGSTNDKVAPKSWRNVTVKRILRSLGENGFELFRYGLFWELNIGEHTRSYYTFEEALKDLGMWIVEGIEDDR